MDSSVAQKEGGAARHALEAVVVVPLHSQLGLRRGQRGKFGEKG